MPLVSVYTRDILHATVGEAQLLPALLLLTTTLLALPMGWLGDRYGKRRVIGAGYAIMGLAALAGMVITTKEQGAAVFLLAGRRQRGEHRADRPAAGRPGAPPPHGHGHRRPGRERLGRRAAGQPRRRRTLRPLRPARHLRADGAP